MTTPTVPVTVTLTDQAGQPVIGAKIFAALNRDENYGGLIVSAQETSITDATGIAVLQLFPNELGTQQSQYLFKIHLPSGRVVKLTGTVPNAACNLENIVNMPGYAGKPDGQLAIDTAIEMLTAANELIAAAANVVDGNTILYGAVAPAAGTGIDGNFYINTATNFIYGPKAAGTWPAGTSLIGPAGAAGATGAQGDQGAQGIQGVAGAAGAAGAAGTNGNTILYGAIAPAAGTGIDGNFYINTATNFIYGPKAAGVWPAGTSLIGPAGAAGATGAQGAQGAQGIQGATGATGAAGTDGNTILYGATAPAAGTGIDGNFYINTATNFIYGPKAAGAWPAGTSLIGPAGAAGATGAQGDQGAQGIQGATGATGAAGTDGNTILYGAVAPAAGTGIDGNFYINTATNFIYGPKAAGVWPAGTSLIGPAGATGPAGAPGAQGAQGIQGATGATGAAGTDGNTILYGAVAPAAGTGIDGNFYINTATNFIYGPKAAGAWPAGTSLVGPAGAAGATGAQGDQGAQGIQGVAGAAGATGATGPQGPEGGLISTSLADGATITIDISTASTFDVTLGGNRAIDFSGGAVGINGKRIMLRLKQDATGSRTVTWGTMVSFGIDITEITLTTTALKTDVIGVIYNHAAAKYDVVAYARGY